MAVVSLCPSALGTSQSQSARWGLFPCLRSEGRAAGRPLEGGRVAGGAWLRAPRSPLLIISLESAGSSQGAVLRQAAPPA